MEQVRQWLLRVTCVALMAALADGMMPKGAVRQVGRLVCALVLLCVVLRPILQVRVPSPNRLVSDIGAELRREKGQLEQTGEEMLKTLIERECEAYIVDKAAALGVQCQAKVECVLDEASLWLPCRADIIGQMSGEQQQRLSMQIEKELGISPECLIYTGGE